MWTSTGVLVTLHIVEAKSLTKEGFILTHRGSNPVWLGSDGVN